MCTYPPMDTHLNAHMQICTYIHKPINPFTHICTQTYRHVYQHTNTCTYIHREKEMCWYVHKCFLSSGRRMRPRPLWSWAPGGRQRRRGGGWRWPFLFSILRRLTGYPRAYLILNCPQGYFGCGILGPLLFSSLYGSLVNKNHTTTT